jgi:hypothetical protein
VRKDPTDLWCSVWNAFRDGLEGDLYGERIEVSKAYGSFVAAVRVSGDLIEEDDQT